MKNPQLTLIESAMSQHQKAAEQAQELARYFILKAEEATAQVEYWTDQRRQYLGEVALDNVIPFPVERRAQ